jgi:hypothetical protein
VVPLLSVGFLSVLYATILNKGRLHLFVILCS